MATGVNNLAAFKKSFNLAMEIFSVSRSFPKEEKYSLTDQIRRSSRSVCANLAEAYSKRRYTPHFISKLTDADMENAETLVWLEFACQCGYISQEDLKILSSNNDEIARLLNFMILHPEKFEGRT